jgi:hypothetical protein
MCDRPQFDEYEEAMIETIMAGNKDGFGDAVDRAKKLAAYNNDHPIDVHCVLRELIDIIRKYEARPSKVVMKFSGEDIKSRLKRFVEEIRTARPDAIEAIGELMTEHKVNDYTIEAAASKTVHAHTFLYHLFHWGTEVPSGRGREYWEQVWQDVKANEEKKYGKA